MAYYPFWALLITLSLLASVGGFLWASRHGQFRDQERARYRPLRGERYLPLRGERHLPLRGERYLPLRGERHLPLRGDAIGSVGGEEHRLGKETVAMLAVLAVGVAGLLMTLAVVVLKSAGNGQ